MLHQMVPRTAVLALAFCFGSALCATLHAAPISADQLVKIQNAVAQGRGATGCRVASVDRVQQNGRTVFIWSGTVAFRGQINTLSEVIERALSGIDADASLDVGKVTVVRPTEAQLFLQLAADLEFSPNFPGCELSAVRYRQASEEQGEIILEGRVAREADLDRVMQFCDTNLEQRFFAPEIGTTKQIQNRALVRVDLQQTAERLKVVPLSDSAATVAFRRGYAAFRAGQYPAARDAFRQAVVDAPENDIYRYFVIVAEIGAGDQNTAYRRLKPLAARKRSGHLDYGEIQRALMDVQGPIRNTLIDLERRAISDTTR